MEEAFENQMPRANESHKSQTTLNPSSKEPHSQTASNILSGWLTKHHVHNHKHKNLIVLSPVLNNIFYLSYSRAWRQIEKCYGGISFEK